MTDPLSIVERLRAAGCVFAEEEAALLVESARDPGHLERLVSRRVAGEPLEPLVGWVDFCGVRVAVAPGVFVPRRRSGLLVDRAVPLLSPGDVVVDMCCGAAALGRVIAERVRGVTVHAVDVDPVAVRCAAANLGPVGGTAYLGDLYAALPAALRGEVRVVVANAPYVPSHAIATMPSEARDHEPRVALDGGADGLDVARRVVDGAPDWLSPDGWLLVETSDAQAPALAAAFEAAGLTAAVTTDDEVAGTAVVGTRMRDGR